MVYRTTPLACGYSPAELLMGRSIRTIVPLSLEMLKPTAPDLTILKKQEQNRCLLLYRSDHEILQTLNQHR